MCLALVLVAGAPLRARIREPALDRMWVERRVFRGWSLRGWGPDGRTMLTLLDPLATD